MLLNSFNPSRDIINKVVFGSGNWQTDMLPETLDVVKSHIPFRSVVTPIREIEVQAKYSIDDRVWHDNFPFEEVIDSWKNSANGMVEGAISFKIELIPNETMSIREIGLFSHNRIVMYKVIKEFVIGKMSEQTAYSFTHTLQCFFATPESINSLIDDSNK